RLHRVYARRTAHGQVARDEQDRATPAMLASDHQSEAGAKTVPGDMRWHFVDSTRLCRTTAASGINASSQFRDLEPGCGTSRLFDARTANYATRRRAATCRHSRAPRCTAP